MFKYKGDSCFMFKSIGKTDIGLKRKINQDYFKLGKTFNASWAIVCDGLGGERAGDVASKMATETIADYLEHTYKEGMDLEDIKNMLIKSFNLANSKIFDESQKNIEYSGMATTAILSFIVDNRLHVAHVGDSRIYLISGNKVNQLTKDDSLVQALVEKGKLSESEAKRHPKRNYLIKAIGVERDVDIYYECFDIDEDDKVLMCTDGLYNYLNDEFILENIDVKKLKNDNLDNIINRFIKLALKGGGSDNITVVIMFSNNYYNDESRVE